LEILKQINAPQDLQKLKLTELQKLAEEIRTFILQTVAETGGHLAPNLGVVELTLALHRVFDTSKDRLVWDVGHQSYVHKILTGRREQFSSLRQYGGLSGFPKREESIHDAFNTGHSSTSIAAALGFALARDRMGEDHHVIAVIGDGSMTGGEAYEALNQAGQFKTNLLVILNDNEMSIAENVGAMSSYLSRLRSDPFYTRRKKDIELLLQKVPAIGHSVAKAAERLKDSLKYLLVPGMIFEELGLTYLGPIDGHNLANLLVMLKRAKSLKGPVLLHVLTQKGRGYAPAEKNPAVFHGVGPFNLKTGELINNNPELPDYTGVFGDTIVDLGASDMRIMAITAAMPEGTGLKKFAKAFPERFFDIGIAEQSAVTMAAAMAAQGLRPVVAIYSSFLQRAYDQISHDVCQQKLPVVFAIDRAGLVGADGATHHGSFDLSYLRHLPGISVLAPKDEDELRHMLYTALKEEHGPTAIRYPRGKGLGVPLSEEYRLLPWGKAEILLEEKGANVLLLAVGSMVHPALKTHDLLLEHGVKSAVVNARFVKPLDEELLLKLAVKYPYLVTMEENVAAGGFGSGVLELLSRNGLNHKNVLLFTLPDEYITHGKPEILLELVGLTPQAMTEQIMQHFALKSKAKIIPRLKIFGKQISGR